MMIFKKKIFSKLQNRQKKFSTEKKLFPPYITSKSPKI